MTAKNIATGIDKIIGQRTDAKNIEVYERTWRDLRNKIDSLLLGSKVLKADLVRVKCQALDQLDQQGRYDHIMKNWGPQYATKILPLLQQLNTVEQQLNKLKDVNE